MTWQWFFGVLGTILSGMALAAMGFMGTMLMSFINEQRKANETTAKFQRSMQRSEINSYFRIVVEEGKPISPEELQHLESCYLAYHENGGNGVGTLMYERIMEHAKLVTRIGEPSNG